MDERTARKKQLIAEGAVYRAELLLARQGLQEALQPREMTHGACRHLIDVAVAAFRRNTNPASPRFALPGILHMLSASASVRTPIFKSLLRMGLKALAALLGKQGRNS